MALCIHGLAFDTPAAFERNQTNAASQERSAKLSAAGCWEGLILGFDSDLQLQ